ncbi:MAG TPA: hypothetical protein VF746_12245 [Longimicrobium sp.]|jgi:hypothetical protein
MERYEHLLALVSIIVGLGLTDLLGSLHRLIRARRRVRWHWLPLLWAAGVLLLTLQYWWVFFRTGRAPVWGNFFAFVIHLCGPILLFLVGAAALPDEVDDGTDLLEQYFAQRHYFFALLALYLGHTLLDQTLRGNIGMDAGVAIRLVAIALLLTLIRSRSVRYHVAATLALLGCTVSYIVIYSLRLE